MNPGPHSRGSTHHFDHDLGVLKERLITMGGLAEQAITRALAALVERLDDSAHAAKNQDEALDTLEIEIDELAIALLTKTPLATDLRLITIAMKISQNLERVGDEATTIARRALELNREPQLKAYVDIPQMASIALKMLKEALDSFVSGDSARARTIIPQDKEVDRMNKNLQRELTGLMMQTPESIARCLNLMVISKSLERIADHATNIAEEVVYLYEGRDIRHSGKTTSS